ncbi:uncharacterized protein LOC143846025 [Tasmannia lanceolata]|uniref:uncharacterized protein LOC143846025 n=1 Tax=Tasmannia lanceolata TaxID=3420 RepID=UPI004063287D
MSNNPRQVLTPGASRKRKERDAFNGLKPSRKPTPAQADQAADETNNQLLAGYLAHEFLTGGTLFGQRWDTARAEAAPIVAESKKTSHHTQRADPAAPIIKPLAYADVAHLLKNDGAHVNGVVNPTQLARWLQM